MSNVETMYAKYGPLIFSRCRRLLRNAAAAEDATQDIFVKIIHKLDSMPDEQAVLPWIHRMTTNHCLNIIRDTRRHAEPTDCLPETATHDFEDAVMSRNFAAVMLANSPKELSEPAMLYHGAGVDQSTVARQLGISRRTVVYRISEFSRRVMTFHAAAEAGRA